MIRSALLLVVSLGITGLSPQARNPVVAPAKFMIDAKGLGIRWARIPSGTFQMGCVAGDKECDDDEKPQHAVTLTRDYWLMTTEVTIEMFRPYAGLGHGMPLQPDWNSNPRQPIVFVPETGASAFCEWLGGRLPTEAESERAARGNVENLKYAWGNAPPPLASGLRPANLPDETWKKKFPEAHIFGGYDDGFARTAPVGSFPPNVFGLYDMAGNVFEWVADVYADHYPSGPEIDPYVTKGTSLNGVTRGGSWVKMPRMERLSQRMGFNRNSRSDDVGFRCAKDVAQAK